MSKVAERNGRWWPHPYSVVVLVALVAAVAFLFAVSRRVAEDEEERLLAERAVAVEAVVVGSFDRIEASLRMLGPVGSSPHPDAPALFADSASRLLEESTRAVGVAVTDGGNRVVRAAVGSGPEAGTVLDGTWNRLAVRALSFEDPQLVSELIVTGHEASLILARRVKGSSAVAYMEKEVQSHRLGYLTSESFPDLWVTLYASRRADPGRLAVSTGHLRLSGPAERRSLTVGPDRWLLEVVARRPLAGDLQRTMPWVLLFGGLAVALLGTTMTETLTRRRSYALALVGKRTRELEETLDELAETQTFLQRLLTAGPVFVLRTSVPDWEATFASPNVERLLGVSHASTMAPGFPGSLVHPEDLPRLQAVSSRVALGLSAQETFDCRFGEGGSFRWVSGTLVPETDDTGEIVAVLTYAVDADDRRRAEEAQRRAQEEAEAANRSKSEFLSRMSHELRTPLNAVLGFGQLLEIEALSDTQREAVDHILKGGRHLLELINEVLDISRVEAGELSLSPEPVLAAELIQDAVDLIRPLADQRGIQLVVDSSGVCDCYVFADRLRVKQVLLNLLSNAVKYNRPRGTVALSCEQPAATRIRITVADTGMGVPAERLGLLFTPFERLGAEHTSEEGTGIGLALSKRLTEAMGGTLTAASTLGQGSTFTVDLPRVEGPVERYERLNGGTEPAVAVEPATQRQLVLHIEDNPLNLALIDRVLAQRPNVEVVAAMHGRLGLELAREHRPAIVLLDLHLPDMGGEQVLQRLRDDPATTSIPVVILSADATPGQVQRLLSAGAAAYLAKPIEIRELLRLIDEATGDQ